MLSIESTNIQPRARTSQTLYEENPYVQASTNQAFEDTRIPISESMENVS